MRFSISIIVAAAAWACFAVPVVPAQQQQTCSSNDNCSDDEARPFCVDGFCAECNTNAHCDALYYGRRPLCDEASGVCRQCYNDTHCEAIIGERPFCDEASGLCHECLDNQQCEGTDEPFCVNDFCVDCIHDQDCPSSEPYCIDNTCHECMEDQDCPYDNEPVCVSHWCKECREDQDCPDDDLPYCYEGYCSDCWGLPTECDEGPCFSGRTVVEVRGQGTVPMDQLKVGDEVRTRNDSYSRVHSFGHYQPYAKAEFLQILTANTGTGQRPLEITADHLLYTINAVSKREEIVPAGQINIGDYVVTDCGPEEVVGIHKTQAQGLYAPLTTTGEISVGGVLASNYVSRGWLKSQVSGNTLHLLQHGAVTIHRTFCEWAGCQQETYDEDTGFSPWVSYWYSWEQWQLHLGAIPSGLFFAAFAPFALFSVLVGRLHLAPMLTLARFFVVLVGIFVLKQQAGIKRNKKIENIKED